jgi:hypothetical protein
VSLGMGTSLRPISSRASRISSCIAAFDLVLRSTDSKSTDIGLSSASSGIKYSRGNGFHGDGTSFKTLYVSTPSITRLALKLYTCMQPG